MGKGKHTKAVAHHTAQWQKSDVMMPEMDELSMLKQIKDKPE